MVDDNDNYFKYLCKMDILEYYENDIMIPIGSNIKSKSNCFCQTFFINMNMEMNTEMNVDSSSSLHSPVENISSCSIYEDDKHLIHKQLYECIYIHIFKILTLCKYKYADPIIQESIHDLIITNTIFCAFRNITTIMMETKLIESTLKLLDNEFWTRITFHPNVNTIHHKSRLNPIFELNEPHLQPPSHSYDFENDMEYGITDADNYDNDNDYDNDYDSQYEDNDLDSYDDNEFNTLFETLEFENKIEENILNSLTNLSNIVDNSLNT